MILLYLFVAGAFACGQHARLAPGFSVARPGTATKIVVEENNVLIGNFNEEARVVHMHKRSTPGQLPLELVNNFNGDPIYAYISGLDSSNSIVFVGADGSLIYPSSNGSTVPVPVPQNIPIPLPRYGESLRVNLPISLTSARIYFSEGQLAFFMVRTAEGRDGLVQPSVSNLEDPNAGRNWGFVELTYTRERRALANISYVDFVGMTIGLEMTSTDATPVQKARGLRSAAVLEICDELAQQTSDDGLPWSGMCVTSKKGKLVRILSPKDFSIMRPESFSRYWDDYVNRVWERYTNDALVIDAQSDIGLVDCRVRGNVLQCAGDNRSYAKPTAQEIWKCDGGPFERRNGDNGVHLAVIPRLCAAIVRSTLLRDGGDRQPSLNSTYYYRDDITHHYSRLVHAHEIDGKGYAFPYDDVNPTDSKDASGVVQSDAVDKLTIYVGGTD